MHNIILHNIYFYICIFYSNYYAISDLLNKKTFSTILRSGYFFCVLLTFGKRCVYILLNLCSQINKAWIKLDQAGPSWTTPGPSWTTPGPSWTKLDHTWTTVDQGQEYHQVFYIFIFKTRQHVMLVISM